MMTPLWRQDALALHTSFMQGDSTPVEALLSCLARISEVQPRINAYTALRTDTAMAEAQASTRRYQDGHPLSCLDGVPLSVKDNLLTADMPTTWGSPGLANYCPGTEELAVRRMRQAGAIVVGKTNVPEFTLEGYTDNALYGATRNPWNTELTPGGSSGGAAASVAAGCTPLALGTDGGGSIRRPAAHCGLVGFKPSLGAIARTDGLPTLLLDFEVVGLMARSVADVKAMLTVTGGAHRSDASSLAAQTARAHPTARAPLRVLYVATLDQAPVDPDIARQCELAAQQLSRLGHEVHAGPLPLDLAPVNKDWPAVSQIGLDLMFAQHPDWGAASSAKYRDMAKQGAARPARELWHTLERIAQLRRDCATLFTQWDVVITPTTAAMPWPAREAYPSQIADQNVGPRGHAVFTGWVNAAGLPGISLPIGCASTGLPIGLHLVTRYGGDDLLLNLASVCEAQLDWRAGWPAI